MRVHFSCSSRSKTSKSKVEYLLTIPNVTMIRDFKKNSPRLCKSSTTQRCFHPSVKCSCSYDNMFFAVEEKTWSYEEGKERLVIRTYLTYLKLQDN